LDKQIDKGTAMTNDSGTKLFCLGLGLGVATAFLLTPKSGRDARQYFRDKADEGTDYLKRQGQELANGAADMLDRGAKAIRHQKENVMAAVDAGREALREGMATTPESDYKL
jgi:gas vesicle protein